MNKEQVYSQLRSLALIVLTYLVSTGKLTQDNANTLIHAGSEAGPIVAGLGIMAYGWWKKRDKAVLQQAAATGVQILVPASASPGAQAAAEDKSPSLASVNKI